MTIFFLKILHLLSPMSKYLSAFHRSFYPIVAYGGKKWNPPKVVFLQIIVEKDVVTSHRKTGRRGSAQGSLV